MCVLLTLAGPPGAPGQNSVYMLVPNALESFKVTVDADYAGYDIYPTAINCTAPPLNVQQCAEACTRQPGCTAFTWLVNSRHDVSTYPCTAAASECLTKSAAISLLLKTPGSNTHVTAALVSAPPPSPPPLPAPATGVYSLPAWRAPELAC